MSRKYVVRYNVEYSAVVKADSAEEAVKRAQKLDEVGVIDWQPAVSPFTCDEDEEA